MEPKESKNKGDVLTLDDVHPAIRFGVVAHRQRKRVGLLVTKARSAELQHALEGYPVRVALPGGGV